MEKLKIGASFLGMVGLLVAGSSIALAQNADLPQNADIARPGTINYIEGSVAIDGQPLLGQNNGYAEVEPGQTLTTGQGKAEMLLTPGIFFRLNDGSAAKMVSPSLSHTVVELDRGRAAVEVDEIFPQNEIQIVTKGNTTQLLKRGLYEFNADTGEVQVFEGKAAVLVNSGDKKWEVVKGDHELALGQPGKPAGFDAKASHDDLYNWSSLRSEYVAEASGEMASEYGDTPGWYWSPYFDGYTFLGLDPFWSPFGWGFYGGGFYGGYYGRGYYGRRGYYGGRGGFSGGGFGGGFHGGGGGGRR